MSQYITRQTQDEPNDNFTTVFAIQKEFQQFVICHVSKSYGFAKVKTLFMCNQMCKAGYQYQSYHDGLRQDYDEVPPLEVVICLNCKFRMSCDADFGETSDKLQIYIDQNDEQAKLFIQKERKHGRHCQSLTIRVLVQQLKKIQISKCEKTLMIKNFCVQHKISMGKMKREMLKEKIKNK